ncbi:acetylglutamate kinase [Listeria monocytogenes]|uniref:Acetylglutamate kinase n=2 Tax=Listeria monocytogenes TaxID=1639 RepID=ARGB_LISMH|nr:acetylglutamate kinase [Listeria monocytogenes]B8DHF2.1 RecName: Full=Acetylglutamate kinase; AltName: Full=N-acetyl-L-glutamate 5-phosphotransferase; AltName: Full=NAG kinase; Short=NAGK [Listeria monocytogenes HCC23]EEP3929376.1 acetylglutamate kinase [Listeria monocytogenes serotype 4ab]ACK39321.1 acetylglutamate kinase [Listeria monocytogenes HCC23]AEH92687.1 acetylglutamate kinase [Listeria monocytogenes M7]AKS54199.1 acetylglutamate kinase [Listeria monocytogenes]EAC2627392.1 acetylg
MENTIVIKLGGVASDNLTEGFFRQITEWQAANKKIVLVHGGGHYITKMMEALAIPVETKNGLRITNKAALEVTKMVLIGQVQPAITTAFQKRNISVIGLNAGDTGLLEADRLSDTDLGLVGKITKVKTNLIEQLLSENIITVIAPLGINSEHDWLNVNADTAACEVASALHAEALYLLTDVPGVKNGSEIINEIATAEIEKLQKTGVIKGGMIPKLASAAFAAENGVDQVIITNSLETIGTKIKSKVAIG